MMKKEKMSLFGFWIGGVILVMVLKTPITVYLLLGWSLLCALPLLKYFGKQIGAILLRLWDGYLRLLVSDKNTEDLTYQNSNSLETVARRQLEYRITETLRSVYPDAVWKGDGLQDGFLLDGGTMRIKTGKTGDCNHAEVTLLPDGSLDIQMLQVFGLKKEIPSISETESSSASVVEPEVSVNVDAWYALHGQGKLDGIIGDLHAQGFRQLRVFEDGSVHINMDGTDSVIADTLDSFPPKSHWEKLQDLLRKDGLKTAVAGDSLTLDWNE